MYLCTGSDDISPHDGLNTNCCLVVSTSKWGVDSVPQRWYTPEIWQSPSELCWARFQVKDEYQEKER